MARGPDRDRRFRYEGIFVKNSKEGKGVETWKDVARYDAPLRYEGEFHNVEREGHGVMVYLDPLDTGKTRYEGGERARIPNGTS